MALHWGMHMQTTSVHSFKGEWLSLPQQVPTANNPSYRSRASEALCHLYWSFNCFYLCLKVLWRWLQLLWVDTSPDPLILAPFLNPSSVKYPRLGWEEVDIDSHSQLSTRCYWYVALGPVTNIFIDQPTAICAGKWDSLNPLKEETCSGNI